MHCITVNVLQTRKADAQCGKLAADLSSQVDNASRENHTPHYNSFTALFPGPSGSAVPEENFWTWGARED